MRSYNPRPRLARTNRALRQPRRMTTIRQFGPSSGRPPVTLSQLRKDVDKRMDSAEKWSHFALTPNHDEVDFATSGLAKKTRTRHSRARRFEQPDRQHAEPRHSGEPYNRARQRTPCGCEKHSSLKVQRSRAIARVRTTATNRAAHQRSLIGFEQKLGESWSTEARFSCGWRRVFAPARRLDQRVLAPPLHS